MKNYDQIITQIDVERIHTWSLKRDQQDQNIKKMSRVENMQKEDNIVF